ncbi:MAG: DUF2250 domain-containing protein [candidate division Zixibacteria bacterium]|nr:DUF2250 domain-containing protein [candidate division Zixibacteria bacterium]
MVNPIRLKEDYILAKCCTPTVGDDIVGYYSYDNVLKVHRRDCPNLAKAEQQRLVKLEWDDILEEQAPFSPDKNYDDLDKTDWVVMRHHRKYGVDYSLLVARKTNITKQAAFDSHKKLREMDLIERVEPRIIQYRKGIVDNKWIKHRNHTYYDLTEKGNAYLDWHAKHT